MGDGRSGDSSLSSSSWAVAAFSDVLWGREMKQTAVYKVPFCSRRSGASLPKASRAVPPPPKKGRNISCASSSPVLNKSQTSCSLPGLVYNRTQFRSFTPRSTFDAVAPSVYREPPMQTHRTADGWWWLRRIFNAKRNLIKYDTECSIWGQKGVILTFITSFSLFLVFFLLFLPGGPNCWLWCQRRCCRLILWTCLSFWLLCCETVQKIRFSSNSFFI